MQARRRLLEAVDAFANDRKAPPGATDPEVYNTWSGYIIAPDSVDWREVHAKNIPVGCEPHKDAPEPVRYGN